MSYRYHDDSDDDELNRYERDPGREVVERNTRNHLQRIADHTKDELSKVLKRVDTTLNNYEYSVQSALNQHGAAQGNKSSVEHLADISELESLLNDSIAKQKYKQRLTVFIVGQTELATEKASLLQQIEQFFSEQKQSFSGSEFNTYDVKNETQDEVDLALRSFDVKDCFQHVKQLGNRLNELNDDIVTYLIQNAAAKHQAKGKKKLAQATKETKDQLSALQQKLESINNEMINKDSKIEALEKANETLQRDLKSKTDYLKQLQEETVQHNLEIKARNKNITELEVTVQQLQQQIEDLNNTIATMQQAPPPEPVIIKEPPVPKTDNASQTDEETSPITVERQIQTLPQPVETPARGQPIPVDADLPDLNVFFNVPDGIDLNNVLTDNATDAFVNLRKFAVIRVNSLLQEQLELQKLKNDEELENLKQEFEDYRVAQEKEYEALMEKAEHAHDLQMKAEKALSHLESLLAEQEQVKHVLIHQQSQTDVEENLHEILSTPENSIPIIEVSNEQTDSENDNSDDESDKEERSPSREKYVSFIEERKNQLGHRTHQPEPSPSRRTSLREGGPFLSLDTNSGSLRHRLSNASYGKISRQGTLLEVEPTIRYDNEQQTSAVTSRRSSRRIPTLASQMIQADEGKLPFYHLYELIYRFRQWIIGLLEQNNFLTLADRLLMIKPLTSDDHYSPETFLDNAERSLKDTRRVLQSCLSLLISSIQEYEMKEKENLKELSTQPTREPSMIDEQQQLLLEQKEAMIIDLSTKYEQLTNAFHEMNTKREEEISQNERFIVDQQKLIQNLQQQVIRLQKRLSKIEAEGIVEPGIMFTRLDAQRNEQTLQQALHKGKVLETTYNELNEAMEDYVNLPSQQLANLVKRYMHFRRANEIEDRIQNEVTDGNTRDVLEKMELLYERRSDEIRRQISNARQQRSHLAQILTEKFDDLEDENSIFLIRPVYSYQGRAAVQSYMKQEKRRHEAVSNDNPMKTTHHPTRQSQHPNKQHEQNQYTRTPMSSYRVSDEEERFFNINQSVAPQRTSPTRQQNDSSEAQQFTVQLADLPRLQEYDIQRTLMPMSHVSTQLLSAYTNDSIDPCVPSLNLRSYLALSRPCVGNIRSGKANEVIHTVSREAHSSVSGKRLVTDARTPVNSVSGDLRRSSPQLPPIKRTLPSSISNEIPSTT
ncbi:unnamed protein product [Adineta ricciae]|uniref:Uncharacterized protein n=1 Tax=Adineta ricciae TaxID=249248 RepID=A0A815CD01_ADIRI|nr:unnamed protein product [Adineta ricciae]CAF1282035.1 unnamed protein product [Adineta ricciae]